MNARSWKQWIGMAFLVFAVTWIAFTRHFSPGGLIGGLAGGAFSVVTARFIPALWPRLRTAQRMCVILAPIGVLWILLFTANRHHNARLVSTSLETAGIALILALYWPFSKAMDALWLRLRRR
jgi:multisubunit Na+/H+ antiporter MnhE subunit